MNRQFTEQKIQMDLKRMKRRLRSLTLRGRRIKITHRASNVYHVCQRGVNGGVGKSATARAALTEEHLAMSVKTTHTP